MERNRALRVLSERGRASWECELIVGALARSGLLEALPDEAGYAELAVAGALCVNGQIVSAQVLHRFVAEERALAERRERERLGELIDSIAAGDRFSRARVRQQVRQMAVTRRQLLRVGIPEPLVVPIAAFLQAADCRLHPSDGPEAVRRRIHQAARRMLEAAEVSTM